MAELPVLNLQADDVSDPLILEQKGKELWGLLRTHGYCYLEGSVVDLLDRNELEAMAKEFFDQPLEMKQRYHVSRSNAHLGYFGPLDEGSDLTGAEFKEGFDADLGYLDSHHPDGTWPEAGNFRSRFLECRERFDSIARYCSMLLSTALQMPAHYLITRAPSRPCQMRLLHYFGSSEQLQGMGEHTDFELFTLMHQTRDGLLIQSPSGVGSSQITMRPDSLVLIAGDQLETMTNGALPAARHSVGSITSDRYSFPYFFSLAGNEIVEPLPQFVFDGAIYYEPMKVSDHVWACTSDCFSYLRGKH